MSDFVFVSPGVKFRERDISFVIRNVGLTTLGLVGETQKGPAFEPIPVSDKNEFRKKFGRKSTEKIGNNLKYQLPYTADAYLSESNQLFVTRVLGLTGYDAGNGWGITVSSGLDPATTGVTNTVTSGDTFTNFTYEGVNVPGVTGVTTTIESNFVRSGNTFTGINIDFIVDTIDLLSGSGTVSYTATTITGTPYEDVDGMIVGVIRSRGNYIGENLEFVTNSLTISNLDPNNNGISAVDDVSQPFTLTATGTNVTEEYTVSLINTSRDYIVNVLGDKPKGKNTMLYVESFYPQLIKKLLADKRIYGVNSTLVELTSNVFKNYNEQYTTPETPWIVSELRGNTIERLFRFISISDGASANKEIKISIQNIDPATKEFDVIIRDFNDTDENVSVLESFTRCSFNPELNNYIGRRIGTIDGSFELRSSYVMLEINETASVDAFPAGFEGYSLRSFSSSNTGSTSAIEPKLLFKTNYTQSDKLRKTYLGISEKAFDGDGVIGGKLDQNLFNYFGSVRTANSLIKTKGFHMDEDATAVEYIDGTYSLGSFDVGNSTFKTVIDTLDPLNAYFDRLSRKFTLVPFGGFDGWDEHRSQRTNTELYKEGGVFDFVGSDYYAYLNGIRKFDNPEEVTINLFATPGINFSDNISLVNEAIDMIENERADSLYIIDAPDLPSTDGYAKDIVELLDTTSIDSNYSATFGPWIEIDDTDNSTRIFIPPTGEVVKAIAFTDKTKYPWFAPAGLTRGATSARRARKSLKNSERDIMYSGRINPLTTFPNVGVAIFGQKTLQVKESLLDRINVRRLLLEVRKLVSNIAIRLVFEQNDQVVRDEFIAKVTPILDNIRRERGLFDFRVIMDDTLNTPESIDRNELYGEILLKPVAAVEFIGIGFTITPSGASFDNI
jgi:hypothetical protein